MNLLRRGGHKSSKKVELKESDGPAQPIRQQLTGQDLGRIAKPNGSAEGVEKTFREN